MIGAMEGEGRVGVEVVVGWVVVVVVGVVVGDLEVTKSDVGDEVVITGEPTGVEEIPPFPVLEAAADGDVATPTPAPIPAKTITTPTMMRRVVLVKNFDGVEGLLVVVVDPPKYGAGKAS
jgi:hypothetical protein